MQDDHIEMEIEIARMGAVYGAAYFTIVASRAKSVQQGFLHERQFVFSDNISYVLPFESRDGVAGSVTLVRSKEIVPVEYYGPLDERGWAFQEKKLSPRTISFYGGQTVWRCRCTNAYDGWHMQCRMGWMGRELEILPGSAPPGGEGDMDNLPSPSEEETRERWLDWWTGTVEFYSELAFTIRRDRALAISAIAQEVNCVLHHDTYLAGIWKSTLPLGLLWQVVSDVSGYQEPDGYQGPSWSWTSTNREIWYNPRVYNNGTDESDRNVIPNPHNAEILNAVCIPVNQLAPYGAVRRNSTSLTIRGHFFEGQVLVKDEWFCWLYYDDGSEYSRRCQIIPDQDSWKDLAKQPGNDDDHQQHDAGYKKGETNEGGDNKKDGKGQEDIIFNVDLRILTDRAIRRDEVTVPAEILIRKFGAKFIGGLVLRPNSDGRTYRRVGILIVESEEGVSRSSVVFKSWTRKEIVIV
jgi:hypothetical protein